MEKKLQCNCGSSVFYAKVKVYLVDLSDALNAALQFLYNEYDQKPVHYPEALLKEIGRHKYDKYNCPSLLMLAFHCIEAAPVRVKNELDNHCAKCEKCDRYLSFFLAETNQSPHPSYRRENNLVLLETCQEHNSAMDEYSDVNCAGCGKLYHHSPSAGLEKIKK